MELPQIMGVLNLTPDSFSDGGRFASVDDVVAVADQMVTDGATVIDVGGESTRPGADTVDPAEEAARVIPAIEALAGRCRISIDTRNEAVARAAVAAGATLINDVSASLAPVAAELGVGWVAMHMAGTPQSMQKDPQYGDVVAEVLEFVVDKAEHAAALGVVEIWIDPGFGFGKTKVHNLALLAGLDRFVASGFPVLVGLSRKATMGLLTAASDHRVGLNMSRDTSPTDDRFESSLAAATWAMQQGVAMVRAHDVRPHVHAAAVIAGHIRKNESEAA